MILTGGDSNKDDGTYSGIIPWMDAKSNLRVYAYAEGTPSAQLTVYRRGPVSGKSRGSCILFNTCVPMNFLCVNTVKARLEFSCIQIAAKAL